MAEQGGDKVRILSSLVQLCRDIRNAERIPDLLFIVTNETRRLVSYRQAFYWSVSDTGKIEVEACYGVSEVDRNAPAICWFRELVHFMRGTGRTDEPCALTPGDLPDDIRGGWESYLAPYGLSVPVRDENGRCIGGLWFASEEPWSEASMAMLSEVVDAFTHARAALEPRGYPRRFWRHLRSNKLIYIAVLATVLLLPIRQYVLSPAEVVPRSPNMITAPIGGVIREVKVEPSERVEEGQLLFVYEDIELRNEVVLSEHAVDVAETELDRNSRQAFSCEACRSRLPELMAVLEREKAQLQWNRDRLERSRVYAPSDGVVVFSDITEWEGRPVSVGETVMKVAGSDETRLRIDLSIDDAIATEVGTRVDLHLNIDPLKRYRASVVQTSYEAVPVPGERLAYQLLADFENETPRLGLRGTAKLYGDRAPLALYLFRRPISWIRRTLGI